MSGPAYRVAWIGLVGLLQAAPAAAQRPPVTVPTPGTTVTTLHHAFDRAAPQPLSLWRPRTVLGFQEVVYGHGGIHVTCTDTPERGRCPRTDTGGGPTGRSPIQLEFHEQRSGQRREIAVLGWLERAEWERACSDDFWDKSEYPLWTSSTRECHVAPAGTAATLEIAARDIAQLVAGRWQAELHLDVRSGRGGAVLGRHVFALEVLVTDPARAAIHFPEHGASVAPMDLQLQVRTQPAPASVGGEAVLEMCLYDGLGSLSSQLELVARDGRPDAPGRPAGHFSVWHLRGGAAAHDRIDYRLHLLHGGRRIDLARDVHTVLDGIDSAELRPVLLPGMEQTVHCVPTPLSFQTPRFPAADKRDGRYQGDLTLEMRLPTRRP
ncbi:CfaE/CblD family pilus tip adhesin [uncultured Stenotrophomonas sp.]|uniref:CfaE/CblD family pilus tip adhesin n=1 Tax=uncultured Stenotrophomonas sp. TaxID=165438 RepID=UPI0028EEA67C|nr:CfaE/CblD family pilus tip adhesin [uncultured Stenotrophomonas sp.]